MSHLVRYDEARTDREKALAAIDVAYAKNSKNAAWAWAEKAVEHAQAAGVENTEELVGGGRYPDLQDLENALLGVIPDGTIGEVLDVAGKGPTGLPDFEAVQKLQDEMAELQQAIEIGDDTGAYLEAADMAYYAAKTIDLAARKVGLKPKQLLGLAVKKYTLRFVENEGQKDDKAERAIV